MKDTALAIIVINAVVINAVWSVIAFVINEDWYRTCSKINDDWAETCESIIKKLSGEANT